MTQIQEGSQLDHFRIDRFVSNSNVTAVYHAFDLNTQQPVALKVPFPQVQTDPVFAERFHREEEIGLTLHHPSIIKVLPNPHRTQTYMVMEWLDGELLRDVLNREGRLSPERAVSIALRIAEALDYIHSHGISHRDLRPEHIMILPDDHIKLIDFGLAGQIGAKRVTFTNLSEIIAHGNYLAPEQIAGKRGDARSDLYALGVILYEMLAGKRPYPDSTSLQQFNDRALQDPPPLRTLNRDISPALEETVIRALERDPAHRYATAREFIHDLAHPDTVGTRSHPEAQAPAAQSSPTKKSNILLFSLLVAIPALIFLLMLLASHFK